MLHKYPKDLVFELLALWRLDDKENEGTRYLRLQDLGIIFRTLRGKCQLRSETQ